MIQVINEIQLQLAINVTENFPEEKEILFEKQMYGVIGNYCIF